MIMAYYMQGIFKPRNPKKYKGDVNKVIYRSGLERRFMLFLDNNSLIKIWSSEEYVVSYIGVDGKAHRYFIDFFVELNNGKKLLIELKPDKQRKPPKKNAKNYLKESITYVTNQLKWESAEKYAKKNGMKFVVVTDKQVKSDYSDNKILENIKESFNG